MVTKAKQKVKYQPTTMIRVEDLRIGDHIVSATIEDKETGRLLAASSHKVDKIEECPGKWRTHIHVNKKDCYDLRANVRVVWVR